MHPAPANKQDCGRIVRCIKESYLTLSQMCKLAAQFSILTFLGKDVLVQLRQILLHLCSMSLSFVELLAQYGIGAFQVLTLCKYQSCYGSKEV